MKKILPNKDIDLIQDTSLKERLLEDLEDHLDELQTGGKKVDNPWQILGDPLSLARQVNAVHQPWIKHITFALLSFLASLLLFYLSFLAHTFPDTLPSQNLSAFALEIIGQIFSIGIIALFLFALTLSVTRWYLSFFGKSFRGVALIKGVVYLPFLTVLLLELSRLAALVANFPFSNTASDILSITLGLLVNFSVITFAQKIAFRYALRYQRWHKTILRYLPYLLAVLFSIGVTISSFDLISDQNLGLLSFPMIVSVILYLFWGFSCRAFDTLLVMMEIPAIYGFVVATAILLAILFIIFGRRIFKKPLLYFERIIIAILLPAFLIIPFKKHDIPAIDWSVPLVWSWEDLEKQQLSFTYPWAAPLMRSNDGINLSYRAEDRADSIIVTQEGGSSYTVTRSGTISLEFAGHDIYFQQIESQRGNLPKEFSCETRPTDGQQVTILKDELFQQNDFFGLNCSVLFYQDAKIAKISKGNLVGLKMTQDGLLAVVINMGSYDPDYVYVVDIVALLSK